MSSKGDAANEMFLIVTGKFLVTEISVELPPGSLMGELGFLTPKNRRTATVECIEGGHVLTSSMKSCWRFTFKIRNLVITSSSSPVSACWRHNAKLEEIIAQNKIAPPIAVASGTVKL